MTDKARELLEKVVSNLYQYDDILYGTVQEIRAYLAQPEVKREALSEEDIRKGLPTKFTCAQYDAFVGGVRFAEKHHGIGGGDENTNT